jgi:hypothetical protein
MGRKKIPQEKRRDKLSISISKENYNKFLTLGIGNKSKLINWLLEGHFCATKEGDVL